MAVAVAVAIILLTAETRVEDNMAVAMEVSYWEMPELLALRILVVVAVAALAVQLDLLVALVL
jgi:hypothetical protein